MKKLCCAALILLLLCLMNGALAGVVNTEMTQAAAIKVYPYSSTFTIPAGKIIFRKVIPWVSGSYAFETQSDFDTYGTLYDAAGDIVTYNDDYGGDRNFKLSADLTAGRTYYLGVRMYNASATGTVELKGSMTPSMNVLSAAPVVSSYPYEVTVSVPANTMIFRKIQPWATGSYTFQTLGMEDTYGELYDAAGVVLASGDDNGDEDNFRIVTNLTEGQTYYLGVRMYDFDLAASVELSITTTTRDASGPLGSGSCGENVTWELSANGTMTISGTGPMADYGMASYGGRYSASTYWNAPWSSYSNQIKRVVVENGVTTIGNYAFYNTNVESVTIPATVTSIGNRAFFGTQLTAVALPSVLTSIGEYAFAYTKLTSIDLPSALTTIGAYAFQHCESLASINGMSGYGVTSKLTSIGEGAFGYTAVTSVTLPSGFTTIAANLFQYCDQLTYISIPGSVTSIGSSAFAGCSAITQVNFANDCACKWAAIDFGNPYANPMASSGKACLYLNGSLMRTAFLHSYNYGSTNNTHVYYVSVSPYAFYNCQNAFEVVSNGGYNGNIGKYAFYNCTNMTGTSLASALGDIGEYAFYNCENISYWYDGIWNGGRTYGEHAFDGCKKLTYLIYDADWFVGNYAFANTGLTSLNFEDGVTLLPSYCFSGCAALSEVKLPDSVTSIGYNTFADCSSLKTLKLSANLQRISGSAFANCTKLERVVFPASLQSIGSRAFENCGMLRNITFDGHGVSIDSYAFLSVQADVTYYRGISWNNKIANYGGTLTWRPYGGSCGTGANWVLDETGVLTITGSDSIENGGWLRASVPVRRIVIYTGITDVGVETFKDCVEAQVVEIPPTLVSFGDNAFADCTAIRSVNIRDINAWAAITRGEGASYPNQQDCDLLWYGQSVVRSVQLDGVEAVEAHAFANMPNLTSVSVPESVTRIGAGAFAGSTNATITLAGNVAEIAADAFGDADSMPQQVSCPMHSATSAALYATAARNFVDAAYPDYVLWDNNGHVGVAAYTGECARLTIPDGFNEWVDAELTINDLILPTTLSETDVIELTARRADVPDGVTSASGVTLHGVEKIRIPASVTDLEGLTMADCWPVVYCYMDSEAELWALINGYDIVYLDEENWDPVLSYIGETEIWLEIGEAYTFAADDFTIDPLPEPYTGVITLSGEQLTIDELTVTPEAAGVLTVVADLDGYTTEITLHVYEAVTGFALDAPEMVVKGDVFVVTLTGVEPEEGTSGVFTWQQDDGESMTDTATEHQFTAPEDSGLTVVTVTAPSGVTASVEVIVPQTLTYTGVIEPMEIGDSVTLSIDDFVLEPAPEGYERALTLRSNSVSIDDMDLTALEAGMHMVYADMYGCTAEIQIQVYAAVEDFELTAPFLCLPGWDFEVTLTGVQPEEDISGLFTWMQDDNETVVTTDRTITYTAPETPGLTNVTVTAPSGVTHMVSVLVPESISVPYLASQTLEIGDALSICVDVNGETYVNDTRTYTTVTVPVSSAPKLAIGEDGLVHGIALGRSAVTVRALDGTTKSYIVTVADTQHRQRTELVDSKEATCTEPGSLPYSTCEICGAYLNESGEVIEADSWIIPAKGHTVVTDAAKDATCTEIGLTEGGHCEVCGEVLTEQETIPMLDHTPVTDEAKEATCTEPGLTEGSHCEVCGEVLTAQEMILMLDHTPVTDEAKDATCTEPGLTEGSHCEVCGKVLMEQETIPMLEHTVVIDAAKEATCTEPGLTEGSHCEVCGEVLTAQEVILATGIHFMTDDVCEHCGLTFDLTGLNVLELPDGLQIIDDNAFEGVAADAIVVPAGCKAIGTRAFADCPALRYVLIYAPDADFAPDAFAGCAAQVLIFR